MVSGGGLPYRPMGWPIILGCWHISQPRRGLVVQGLSPSVRLFRELSTLRQMMEVPNEPGLSPNNGLENALLSDQSMASNPRKGQAKRSGAKTTSHDGKAGHVMTHVCHCVLQED
ncbi:TPA: hypothetical protein ACH3X2_004677 [Trebouxia sp. C0005]